MKTLWLLIAIFASNPDTVHESYATKQACEDSLNEMRILAVNDFYTGRCTDEDEESDVVVSGMDPASEFGP